MPGKYLARFLSLWGATGTQKGPVEERFDSNGNLSLGLGELVVAGLKQGRDKNLPVYYRRLNIAKSKERTG